MKAIAAALTALAAAQAVPARASGDIPLVLLHPIFAADYACSEHWEGQLPYLGDARGTDCFVTRMVETPRGGAFPRPFAGDGLENQQWFSWGEPVLAPIDGEVVRININPAVNRPGEPGEPPASMIAIRGEEGVIVLLAHIADPTVKERDKVVAGQAVAVVGNNGYGRSPHVHVGAFRDNTPLQIRWDLNAAAKLRDQNAGKRP